MNSDAEIDAEEGETTKSNGSRFNALKHGLTAKTAVLPGEDPELLQAKIDIYKTGLETRSPLEDDLAEKAALASWQMDRAVGIHVAQVKCQILTKPAADQLREDVDTATLGNRLYHERGAPIELYPGREHDFNRPRTSWDDDPDDPDHPAIVVRRLTASISGCRLLRARWAELRSTLKSGLGLQSHDKLKMIRLMGYQPINAISTPEVARVFLACHALEPQFPYAFQELRCEIHENQFKICKERLERWTKTGIAPANKTAARWVLLGIIDKATERLRVVEAELQETAEKVEREKAAAPGLEDSKASQQFYRHLGSCNRLIHANLNAIHKLRRNEADGWGRTRQLREQRTQGGGRRAEGGGKTSAPVDDRLVVDERGTVRQAYGYDGDLEEGLARFEAEFGKGDHGMGAEARNEIDETQVRAVPDFARWKRAEEECGVGGDEGAKGEVAGGERGVEGEAGIRGDGPGVGQDESVTQVLMEQGGQSNVQNEIGGDFQPIEPADVQNEIGGDFQPIEPADGGGGRASGSQTRDGGARKSRPTGRYWKRDRKQWRKQCAKLELACRQADKGENVDVGVLKEMRDRVGLKLPNSIKMAQEFDRRSP